jgi:hypothetical protein
MDGNAHGDDAARLRHGVPLGNRNPLPHIRVPPVWRTERLKQEKPLLPKRFRAFPCLISRMRLSICYYKIINTDCFVNTFRGIAGNRCLAVPRFIRPLLKPELDKGHCMSVCILSVSFLQYRTGESAVYCAFPKWDESQHKQWEKCLQVVNALI